MTARSNDKLTLICLARNVSKTELFFVTRTNCQNYINSFPFHLFPNVGTDYIIDTKIAYPWLNTKIDSKFGIPEYFMSYRTSGSPSTVYSPVQFLRSYNLDVTETEVETKISEEALKEGVCPDCRERGFAYNCAFSRADAIVKVLLDYFGEGSKYFSTIRLLQVYLIRSLYLT